MFCRWQQMQRYLFPSENKRKTLEKYGNYIRHYTESSYYMYSDNRPSVSSYLRVTHPLNPPPVRGTLVGTRKDILIWNTVSVNNYQKYSYFPSVSILARLSVIRNTGSRRLSGSRCGRRLSCGANGGYGHRASAPPPPPRRPTPKRKSPRG